MRRGILGNRLSKQVRTVLAWCFLFVVSFAVLWRSTGFLSSGNFAKQEPIPDDRERRAWQEQIKAIETAFHENQASNPFTSPNGSKQQFDFARSSKRKETHDISPDVAKHWAHVATLRGEEPKYNYDTTQFKERKQLPTIFTREDLAFVLAYENMTTGAELGVLRGGFSRLILSKWSCNSEYLLVDLWKPQANYLDASNSNELQNQLNYGTTLSRVRPWRTQVRICKNSTVHCARMSQERRFDFVYVDARHDYKGVLADLHAWWPLVADGGIMAGHDYVYQSEAPSSTGQNWTLNYDGTVDPLGRAVKGAVKEFFEDATQPERFRTIYVTKMNEMFPTWMVRK